MSDRRVLTAAQDEGFSHLSIDLTSARVEELFKSGPFSGLIILNFGGIPNATIRFNSISAPPIPLLRGFQYDSQSGSFQRFFLTHDALPGETLDLILIRDPDVSIRLGGTAGLVNVGAGGLAFSVGADNADAVATSALLDKQEVMSRMQGFNGTSMDLWRNNEELVLLPSASRVADGFSPILTNFNARGILIGVGVTINPGGGETLLLRLQSAAIAGGPSNSQYAGVADALGGNPGNLWFLVYPGVLNADFIAIGQARSGCVGRTFSASVTHSGAGAWTYSVNAVLLT